MSEPTQKGERICLSTFFELNEMEVNLINGLQNEYVETLKALARKHLISTLKGTF